MFKRVHSYKNRWTIKHKTTKPANEDTDSSTRFFQPWQWEWTKRHELKLIQFQRMKKRFWSEKRGKRTYPLSPRTMTLSKVLLRNDIAGYRGGVWIWWIVYALFCFSGWWWIVYWVCVNFELKRGKGSHYSIAFVSKVNNCFLK